MPFVSRLSSLVGAALDGTLVGDAMSVDETVAYTYLPEAEVEDALAQRILRRTYGVWSSRPDDVDAAAAQVAYALQGVGQQFVAVAEAPAWTTDVAYRSGLPLPDIFLLYRAVANTDGAETPSTIEQWLQRLLSLLRAMPSERVEGLLFRDLSLAGLTFANLLGDPSDDDWTSLTETILRYMRGESISAIAAYATGTTTPVDAARTVGSKPIPKTLSLIQQMAYRLSMVAGGLSALWAVGDERERAAPWTLTPGSNWSLNALPLAVRCGASDRSSLAWFRFGIRHRVTAHALARTFPVPNEVEDDTATRNWIREQRRMWLDGAAGPQEPANPDLAAALRLVAEYEGI